MSKIHKISGWGIPVTGDDIDTDRIIPARFLRCVTFDGLGEHAFADDRAAAGGKHPFDLPQYQNANILVVNNNFGCGSSREHAPQAIAKWGIQAIVGESFAEIFLGNCVAIGIPCLKATAEDVKKIQELLSDNPQISLTVDLEKMQAICGDFVVNLEIDPGSRQMFLQGTWDNCGQLIANAAQIKTTAAQLPYISWQSA